MNELTTDQKIELMKLASLVGVNCGETHGDLQTTLNNYKAIVEAITSPKEQ